MPKEKFYDSTRIDGNSLPPELEIAWGLAQPQVTINNIAYDRSGLNRMISVLRKARNQTYGADE